MIREDLFLSTLTKLGYGSTQSDLSQKLTECINASRTTGKMAELTLTLKIKSKGAGSQVFINEKIKAKLPQFEREDTILFPVSLPEGGVDLVRNDPQQESIPGMRIVEDNLPKSFKSAG